MCIRDRYMGIGLFDRDYIASSVWGAWEKGTNVTLPDTEAIDRFNSDLYLKHGFYPFVDLDIVVMPDCFPHDILISYTLAMIHPNILTTEASRSFDIASKLARLSYQVHSPVLSWDSTWTYEAITRYMFRNYYTRYHDDQLDIVDAKIGYLRMVREAKRLGEEYTTLKPNITQRYPLDIAVPVIQGEKGYHLLLQIANITNSRVVDAFIIGWVDKKGAGGAYPDILGFFGQALRKEFGILHYVPLDDMLKATGIPESMVNFNISSLKEIDQIVNDYIVGKGASSPSNFEKVKSLSQKLQLVFFEELLSRADEVTNDLLARLKTDYTELIHGDYNEIKSTWFQLCFAKDYMKEAQEMTEFLSKTGVIDHIRPIYRSLKENGRTLLARNVLETNAEYYHPFVYALIKGDLSAQREYIFSSMPYSRYITTYY
eukprot:TRINITY_DN4344_c0_g1_i5.p1 TRINITY_DN4344_c0_g1~~TRINITY_DN4344_c0_g1_i5.p1  ORF type:complete len:452 (+),score=113.38 TRINITY_DN4344_c0_g1_i5:70-1356(+)